MNREIKYRIRLKAVGKGTGYEVGEEITILNEVFNKQNGVAFFQINKDWEVLFADQYTGLKDKNGTEIYEGDIVDIHQTVNGQSKFVIKSCLGCYDVRYAYDIKRKYEYDVFDLLDVRKHETEIEVIGNIYEHKHLLA